MLAMRRSIHVFATDFLPFPGCSCTAGGNRGIQIISALRNAGHSVTYSMPLVTHAAKLHASKVLPTLTEQERWCCDNFFDSAVVLNRIQPDIAVYGNVETFRPFRNPAKDVIHIFDLNGPIHFEGLIMGSANVDAVVQDGAKMTQRSAMVVEQLRHADYVLTVSDRQKYFWLAYCSLAGFSFADLNVLTCPFSFPVPKCSRDTAPNLTVVHAGGFYPWQRPDGFLRTTAEYLDAIPGACLHILGGALQGLPNEKSVNSFFAELQKHRSVKLHGFLSLENLTELLSHAWAGLDLMERNFERELAINGRTIQFLASGTPLIYNNYSTLSSLVSKYNAGWTIPVDDPNALPSVLGQLRQGGPQLVDELSMNSKRLAREALDPDTLMGPLVELCGGPLRKRTGFCI